MNPRTKARRRALEVLHQADVAECAIDEALATAGAVPEFAREILRGIGDNRAEIDATIRRFAERWELERMPVVDRNLLRIGIYEILYRADVPIGATINDVVDLAKLLSTPDSGRFVNGMLGRIAREHERA
ncbi:MAG: transcription antitermination factor NusB [Acidobacteria bacterium]|nr:transcription antitermination factor NusB [Acidobacteriota bacterium]